MDEKSDIDLVKNYASQGERAGSWFSIVIAMLILAIFLTLFILTF